MPRELPESLDDLAWFQGGVLAARQILGAGLSWDLIQSRVRGGHWQRLHAGVYATCTGEVSRNAVLWGAVLRAGTGAMLSFRTAAEVSGLADRRDGAIHVTVPAGRQVTAARGLVVHRCSRAAEMMHPRMLPPRTRVEETVLDLAGAARCADDAYGWVTRAVGKHLTTPERLAEAMGRRGKLRWRAELAAAVSEDGVHSGLEFRYLRDVERAHRLPHGIRQARVRRGGRSEYRDVLYEGQGVVIELDGQAAHPGDTRWRDIRRDNAAAADGLVTLRYGWPDVSLRPCGVAAQVAEALRRRGYAGYRPCSAACAVAALPPAA